MKIKCYDMRLVYTNGVERGLRAVYGFETVQQDGKTVYPLALCEIDLKTNLTNTTPLNVYYDFTPWDDQAIEAALKDLAEMPLDTTPAIK